MDEVAALVGNVLVEQTVFLKGLLVVPGPGLHSGEFLLHLCQLFLGAFQPMRRVRHGAGVGYIKVREGILQTYRFFWRGSNFRRRFRGALV